MGLTLGHGVWQIDQPSNGSMWNSYSFQPVGQWMGYSFTDLGAEGCCRSLNALLDVVMFSFDFKPTVPFWSWDLDNWQKLLRPQSLQWDPVLTLHLYRCFLGRKIGLWQVCVLHYFNWPNIMFQISWHTRIGNYLFWGSFVFLDFILYCNHMIEHFHFERSHAS